MLVRLLALPCLSLLVLAAGPSSATAVVDPAPRPPLLLDEDEQDDEPVNPAGRDGPRPVLAEIFRAPDLLGLRPSRESLSPDGAFALWWWTDEHTDEPERDLWIADTTSGEARVLFSHEDDVSVSWAPRGATLLVEQDGWIDRLDLHGDGRRQPLFEAPGGARRRALDDGRLLLATAGERDLWLLDLASGTRRRLASELRDRSSWFEVEEQAGVVALFARPAEDADGDASEGDDAGDDDEPRLHLVPLDGGPARRLDVTRDGSVDLSPDGRWALISDSDMLTDHDLIMADYLGERVRAVPVRNSLAGDPAPAVSLRLHDVQADEGFELPLDGAERFYLRRTAWSPDGRLLLVERLSEDFHVRQLVVVDPASRSARPVFSERDEAWVGGPFTWCGWNEDGSRVLFTSEISGFNHLYAVPPTGSPYTTLTEGPWEVQRVTQVEDGDTLLVEGQAPDDPATLQVLVVPLDGSAPPRRVTPADSWTDRVRASRDGSVLLVHHATLGRPWDLYVVRPGQAGPPLRLTHSVPAALDELRLPPPELVTYTNPDDGAVVHAYLYKPADFDPARQYPAVMFIHGAGYLQQVRKNISSYGVNMLFHQRLARKGYVVIDPDYRHSKGYGRDFRAAIHGHMGGKDLDDAVAGVQYLETLGYVDTSRVGIYGGSYGGFLTLMALFTQPEVFACGAALRSVTDWRVYNHWYTNPRLGDPEDDAEAYEKSSPIDHVDGLTNPLLLLHGLQDSNVFAQDTIRLVEELIERGKDFDCMLYPSQNHGFDDPDSWIDEYGRIERLFDEVLQPGTATR